MNRIQPLVIAIVAIYIQQALTNSLPQCSTGCALRGARKELQLSPSLPPPKMCELSIHPPSGEVDHDLLHLHRFRFNWYDPVVVDGFEVDIGYITTLAFHLHSTRHYTFYNKSEAITTGKLDYIDVQRTLIFVNRVLRKAHLPLVGGRNNLQIYAVAQDMLSIWFCTKSANLPQVNTLRYMIGANWNDAEVSVYLSQRHRYPLDADFVFDIMWHTFSFIMNKPLDHPKIISGYSIENDDD